MAPFPNRPPSALPRPPVQDEAINPPQTEQAEPDDELLKLGGLYPSRSGNALLGGINLSWVPRGGTDPVGTLLIEKIQRAMDLGRPLRFCVFENSGKFQNQSPYSIHVAVGRPRQTQPGSLEGTEGTQESQRLPPVMAPLPPRPVRRTAPRR